MGRLGGQWIISVGRNCVGQFDCITYEVFANPLLLKKW